MLSTTALTSAPPTRRWALLEDPVLPEQTPLPFPGVAPVLPAPVEREDIGPLRDRCARFMQALVEVLSGDRPCRQMQTWLAPDVFDMLTRRISSGTGPVHRTGNAAPARLVSVHVSMVGPGVAEIAARMVHRGRSRAVAVRLETYTTHRGERTWRSTAVEWA